MFQVFTDDDICHLLKANGYGKHKVKNEYLIFLPLSLSEHNQMMVHDFINKHDEVYRNFTIPEVYTKHKKKRVLELPENFCITVENYLRWFVNQDMSREYIYKSNTYLGLSK